MKNYLISSVFLFSTLLTGCSSVMEPTSFIECGGDCEEPSASNNFIGRFVLRWDAKNDLVIANNIAIKYCASYSGVKSQPSVYTRFTNYVKYQFQCNGYTQQVPATQLITKPQIQTFTTTNNATELKTQIEEAKTKCVELGFKANTEAFGKCVLKLTN